MGDLALVIIKGKFGGFFLVLKIALQFSHRKCEGVDISPQFFEIGIRTLDLFSKRGNGFEDLPKVGNPTQGFMPRVNASMSRASPFSVDRSLRDP